MNVIEAVPHVPEADSFQLRVSLSNLLQAVMVRKWVVVATTVLTTALVIAYIWIWPPTFQVEVMVAADSDKDVQRNTFYNGWNVFRKESLADEAALMTSSPVLKETIRRLDLKYADVYHPFMSYLTHLWGESWVGRNYRKVKYWLFPKKLGPYEPTPKEVESYKVFADFQDGVRVEQVKEASIGLLVVKASSQRAAEIANTMIDVYLDQRRGRQIREAQQAHKSLTEEVEKAEIEIRSLDEALEKYRSDNSLLLQFEKDKVELGQYQGLRLAVVELEAHVAEQEGMLEVINRNLAIESRFMDSDRVFRDTAAHDRLVKLEAQLANLKQLFQPESPEVREAEEQIRIAMAGVQGRDGSAIVRNSARVGDSYEQLRARKALIESQLAGNRASLAKKRDEAARLRVVVDRIPAKMKANHEFERQQAVMEGKLRALYEKLAIVTVSLATARSAPSALRVVEYAVPPEQPIWPKTKLFLAAAVLSGLLIGVMAALLLELTFVRVNRFRLLERDSMYRVFAVVDQDEKFLNDLYSRPAEPRLIRQAGPS